MGVCENVGTAGVWEIECEAVVLGDVRVFDEVYDVVEAAVRLGVCVFDEVCDVFEAAVALGV